MLNLQARCQGRGDKTVGDGECRESHGSVGRLSLRFMGQSGGGGVKMGQNDGDSEFVLVLLVLLQIS